MHTNGCVYIRGPRKEPIMATISSIMDSKNINLNNNLKLAQHRAKLEAKVQHIMGMRCRKQVKVNKVVAMLMDLVNNNASFSAADHDLLVNTLKQIKQQ